jgi:hypothetical protein
MTPGFVRFRYISQIRISNQKQAMPLADTLLDGGLPMAEITLRTSRALGDIASIRQIRNQDILSKVLLCHRLQVLSTSLAGRDCPEYKQTT